MADLIVGFPTNLTTASAGAFGRVRITFAPWELDWEWFDLIPDDGLGGWLANTTTGVSSQINLKGGTEATGYWFDINPAFPNANWNSGDRITPQRQAAINQYATMALALAGMAVKDYWMVWYQNTANRRKWNESASFAGAVCGSVWGMLSRCQIVIGSAGATRGVTYSGAFVGQDEQVHVRNLLIGNWGSNSIGVLYTAGGQGVRVSRNLLWGGSQAVTINNAATPANSCQVDNNFIFGSDIGITAANRDQKFFNNTILFSRAGFNSSTAGIPSIGNQKNNAAMGCETCFSAAWAPNARNSADTDGTLPVDVTNLRNLTRQQLQFFYDLARAGNKAFPPDGRIHHDSVLAGAGLAIAGLTRDWEGQLRPDPPSIGAWEPFSTAYAPAAQLVRGMKRLRAGA